MRIVNKMSHTCYFPYAGSGRRGVNLKTQEQSPEIPIERVNHPSLRSDLRRNRVSVLLTPKDKASLKSLVDADTLALLEGSQAAEKPEDTASGGRQMDARPPEEKKDTGVPDAVYSSGDKSETVDAVKDELDAKTKMMSDEGKKQTLDEMSESDDVSTAEAAQELKDGDGDDDGAGGTGDDTSVSVPANDTDADGSGDESSDEPPSEKPKLYTGMKKTELLSECLRRELPAKPSMKKNDLRQLLIDDDAGKAEGAGNDE